MTAPPPTACVPIDHYSAVHVAAETARALARDGALPAPLPDQAAVLASELGSNLAKHAVNGALYVQRTPLGDGIEILAADRGPGMPEVGRCLADGYTTTDTLGAGLGAVGRIATTFTIRSAPADGTFACARLTPSAHRADALHGLGAICLPAAGERLSGDACAVADGPETRTALVVDGLGHGPQAAEAAQLAVRTFRREPHGPLPDILHAVHRALRHTRGAAVALLRLHPDRAEYCGVGNVRALVVTPDRVHHQLTGQPGVAGLNLPRAHPRELPMEDGATAVLHTDGLDHRWTRTPPPFLLRLPPPLLVTALAHGHRRTRDDATVLAANRYQRPL
ncbi:SpoIIE family protein phosphatase [Streptomyces sp. NRRL S-1448]|uniref:SpoIIE family protein phosphatase n=1 Tax=Streptomyces sp. NRRL S-1448 TaxID=1463883 RepID=UPI0004BECB58|nr:SpoIIE family protein phosphatase [Streptomyces sp. NRRL S-1448]